MVSLAKDASIVAKLEFLGSSNRWNVNFARAMHNWEVDVFASFLQVLHSVRMRRGCEDQLWWAPSKRGLFKVNPCIAQWILLKVAASLEEYMANSASLEGGFFCVVSSSRQDPHLG